MKTYDVKPAYLIALAGAVLLYVLSITGEGESVIEKTVDKFYGVRGIRNNNPGNIDRNHGTRWKGMSADQSSDARFIVFDGPEWGIRAMARVLRNYSLRGITTIDEIVSTWAPATENNTVAYANAVADSIGLSPGDEVPAEKLADLIAAIIRHENGVQPYSISTIERGILLERTS